MRPHSSFQHLPVLRVMTILGAFVLAGCSDGKPAPSGAARYLREAGESEKMAMGFEEKGDFATALTAYRETLSKIETGLKCAHANERPPFRTIKERVEPKVTELEQRERQKIDLAEAKNKKAAEEQKAAEFGKANASKNDETKQKAQEEAKKKETEARAEQLKALTAEKAVKPAKADDPEADDDRLDKPTAGDATKKKEDAAKAPAGPFKVYEGKEKPRLTVDKVEVRGEFMYAYIQINNTSDKNLRIARPAVTFTTPQDADVCGADASFQYEFFDKTIANPLEQTNQRTTITGGSHEALAESTLQIVAISQDKAKAPRVRRAKVAIHFENGEVWNAKGPEDARSAPAEGLPGL